MLSEGQADETFELTNRALPPRRIFVDCNPNEFWHLRVFIKLTFIELFKQAQESFVIERMNVEDV